MGNIALKKLNLKTVAEKVSAKLTASGKMGLVSKSFARYFLEGVEEGVEEGLQSYTSSGIKALASVLQEEGVETQSAWEASAEAWESFKGGLAGGLLLGIPGALIDGRTQIAEASSVRKQAQLNPSKEDFIKNTKDLSVFDGMSDEQKEEHLSNYYESQKREREAEKRERIKDYERILSEDVRITGEAVIDDEGNTVYERDEKGNIIYEENEGGEKSGKIKRYGEAEDVIRHGERLYITEGRKKEKANGDITGEYIAGNPTEETEYNDYAHIDYTYNKAKNTVRIDDVRIQNPKYGAIVKEFIRDFGEKFAGAQVKWNPASESFARIKAELIAENPNGKAAGLQYFSGKNTQAEERAEIKLYERLKRTMPALNETERRTAAAVFKALAHGAGMDSETYMNTYYAEEVLTNRPHAALERTAAQQDIDTKNIKGAVDFKQLESDIKALVYVSEKSDFSTFVHEAAHVARHTMKGDLLLKAEKAFAVEGGKWTRAQEERFAKGFEQYLKEGKAPSEELKTVFQKAAEFLSRIYKSLKEIVGINDEIRAVYDELLGAKDSPLKAAEERILQNAGQADGQKVFVKTLIKSVEEVKKALENIKNTDITNESTGITARISSTGINKMTSNKAVEKSEANGFTRSEHYGAAAEIKTLYEKARLIGEHADNKNSRSSVLNVKRFAAPVALKSGKNGEALITVKETEEHGHRIYSIELDEIIKPSERWGVKNEQPQRWETAENSGTPTPTASEHTVADLREKDKGAASYEEEVNTAYEEAGEAARLAAEKKRYEAETIAWYKEHHSGADGEEIKELIKKEAACQRMSYEEYVKAFAKEQRTVNELEERGIFFQTEPTTEELKEIDTVRAKYENTDKWLKAPNGNKTNLSEKQWLQVRTDSFKKWFGDWENNPENASKVVDENGEPLVVYHGTNSDFDTFDIEKIGQTGKAHGAGFYFSSNEKGAAHYGENILGVFLNAKKLISDKELTLSKKDIKQIIIKANSLTEDNDVLWAFDDLSRFTEKQVIEKALETLSNSNSDMDIFNTLADFMPGIKETWEAFDNSVNVYIAGNNETYYILGAANQIKSATDNNGDFDVENDNILFQTEPTTEEEARFKEAAEVYRAGVKRFFDGNLKGAEVLTVCGRTPAVLRAAGFEDKPITVTGETFKHITAHEEISEEILKTLPEEFLNPVAVFKSQKEDKPNSRLIFTEHFVNGKPVVAAIELNYKEDRAEFNSIRSVYERDVYSKKGINILQENFIDAGLLLYLDDKRAESFSTSTGVSFPLTGSHQLINPSASSIGERGKNVNRDFLTKSDIIGENAEALYFQTEKDFFNEVQGETEEETKENIEKIIVGLDSEYAAGLLYASEEERAKADKAYRDAITPELEKALQKDAKDEKVKDETFLKMMANHEAARAFLKQTAQADRQGLYRGLLKEAGGGFITLANRIAEGKPLTDKQTGILNKYINGDIASYRNLFAELNGFTALRSLTESEKAFTEVFARAKAEGRTEKVKPKTRAEIQDGIFLEEIADDEKFNEFLNEAASAYFFDFENFKAQDAEDAAYRAEAMRKNERVNREMRNFSWKAAFAKVCTSFKLVMKYRFSIVSFPLRLIMFLHIPKAARCFLSFLSANQPVFASSVYILRSLLPCPLSKVSQRIRLLSAVYSKKSFTSFSIIE